MEKQQEIDKREQLRLAKEERQKERRIQSGKQRLQKFQQEQNRVDQVSMKERSEHPNSKVFKPIDVEDIRREIGTTSGMKGNMNRNTDSGNDDIELQNRNIERLEEHYNKQNEG